MTISFLIMAGPYDPNNGGCIVLHKLCDQLNRLGYPSKLVPAFNNFVINKNDILIPVLKFFKEGIRGFKQFKLNMDFLTPVAKLEDLKCVNGDTVVIYPETILGNPLNARNVVRWLLHHPGFHTNKILYGVNELYFKYHSGINVPQSMKSSLSPLELRIVHYPLDLYNLDGISKTRNGSAYMMRKCEGKKIAHDLSDSIRIDGMSHKEISAIFKRVKVFYSYDPYTAYSTFAPLCGCDSVVIPDEGVSLQEWLPDPIHRAGIAYGVAAQGCARLEWPTLVNRVGAELEGNVPLVNEFAKEVSRFFQDDGDNSHN